MLQEIRVRNIALMDEAMVELSGGLNALTGETGAGKSILLGSINLALGGRGGKEMMRDPEKGAEVVLVFRDESPKVQELLKSMAIDSEEGEIMISRRYLPSGRSSLFVNGVVVSGREVRELSSCLIDIHGQHEHQSLMNVSRHIELLDRFIPAMPALLSEQKRDYEEAAGLKKDLQHYEESGRERVRLLSLMEYEINEIEETAWQKGEEESLQEEKKRLLYSERLQEESLTASSLMRDEDAGGRSAISRLDEALGKLRQAETLDPVFFSPYVEQLTEQIAILEDTAASLEDYGNSLEGDPEKLNALEDRLTAILHLKEKYGGTHEAVMAYLAKAQQEKEKLQHLEETKKALTDQVSVVESRMNRRAHTMHELRSKAGDRLSKEITEELSTLQFEDPLFQVDIREKAMGPQGADQVAFMIRTNVGEQVLPLSEIASGGEMSRIMLAIKTVLARQDEIGTMIFDEIDTGISGRTAQRVAEKMSQIALYHQVICVTHLPQIAAMANVHLHIEKAAEEGHTATTVTRLTEEEVPEELARMLGGAKITAATRESAREMRDLAAEYARKLRIETAADAANESDT